MWIVCITSVRHVLTVNGYGGRQTKENEKSWCFKGWETLVSNKYKLILLTQKQFKTLRTFGFNISEDIANRKADFILLDYKKKKAINFEVNFYNGSGSKPEEIIDSYINRQNDLKSVGIDFALVTDGKCWSSASNQLSKGFRHLDFLLNFYMLKHGMLDEIVNKIFFNKNND